MRRDRTDSCQRSLTHSSARECISTIRNSFKVPCRGSKWCEVVVEVRDDRWHAADADLSYPELRLPSSSWRHYGHQGSDSEAVQNAESDCTDLHVGLRHLYAV